MIGLWSFYYLKLNGWRILSGCSLSVRKILRNTDPWRILAQALLSATSLLTVCRYNLQFAIKLHSQLQDIFQYLFQSSKPSTGVQTFHTHGISSTAARKGQGHHHKAFLNSNLSSLIEGGIPFYVVGQARLQPCEVALALVVLRPCQSMCEVNCLAIPLHSVPLSWKILISRRLK